VTTCQDFDVLITLRATGDLDDDEAKRLELHLAACERCRAEAERDAAVLRQVRLPGPSDAEHRATASLARSTLAELHRREGRLTSLKRAGVALAAVAAILVAVLAPALFGRRVISPGPGAAGAAAGATAEVAETSTWEPDLDAVWGDTAVLDDDASTSAYDASDATVASLDY
jgi:anti-sigma factor RsiW